MKNILKFIIALICYLIRIPIFVGLTVSLTWYTLPAIQTTFVGEWILSYVTMQEIFIITMSLLGGGILFFILGKIFNIVKASKPNNFYTHFITWLLAICLAAEALFTFFISGTLHTISIEIDLFRKIAIGVGVLLMFLYSLLHKKIGKLVDRKIQAYDTAKELNAKGRSSVVFMQILKALDFVCPEVILLATLCFAFNFEVSLYFIFVLAAFILPLIGNMICDKRVKVEAERSAEDEREVVVNETATAVVDLLTKQQGTNK